MKDKTVHNNYSTPKSIDFLGVRNYIIKFFEENLGADLSYHSLQHTLSVESAVTLYAKTEEISEKELLLLKTAALFHDIGYIDQYKKNEPLAVTRIKEEAPKFGYTENDIAFMTELILATSRTCEPKTLFEKLLCDADHDYLGRDDYHELARLLYIELNTLDQVINDAHWLDKQIHYLETEHKYYTQTAIALRQKGKEARINELKKQRALLNLEK